jgi:murein L,D-transpeptidase YcbB/YkuD
MVATLLLACALRGAGRAEVEVDVRAETAAIARLLAAPGPVVLDDAALEAERLRTLYGARGNAPLWTAGADGAARVAALASTFGDAGSHGLDPAAYHVAGIERRRGTGDPVVAAELDILLTDALMRYAVDVHVGRAAPARRGPEVDVEPRRLDPLVAVAEAAAAPDLRAWLEALPPQHPEYARLRALLARYRALAAAGGWPVLPEGPKLEVGAVGPVVTTLRRRLVATGDLPAAAARGNRFDAAVRRGVQAFQRRHGLVPDGVVGAATRAALDVDVDTRIDQIVANLERWRWLPDDLGARYVVVDIPAFTAALVEGGRPVLAMPVVVGRPDRMTPILAAQITRLTFNPSWTVPTTIADHDMLGRIRRDASYFASEGIRVYSGPPGERHEIDPATVDWRRSRLEGLKLRQPPGPKNPLGRVRFDMPNINGVYLHDSPARGLFRRPVRAFSSGCVRLGDALELAWRLLDDLPEWTPERRAALLGSWQTRTVTLRTPVPVYLLYRTVWVDEEGVAHFRDDLYGHDRRLLQALRHPRAVLPAA